MSFLKNVALAISASALIHTVSAHGLVKTITLDGVDYEGYPAFYAPDPTLRIVRAMHNNGPITEVTSKAIACNGEDTPAALVAPVTAGSTVTFTWDSWPEGHKGPITNYMASCGANCTTFDATTGKFFKVEETGYDNGAWTTDTLIANGLKYSFKIPANIPNGEYLIRHEILALHDFGHPQYYPSCTQVSVKGGSGSLPTTNLVTFPGAYSSSDPGYSFNIYYPPFTSYPIEGPAVFDAVSAGNGTASSAIATSTAISSSAIVNSTATAASATTTAAATTSTAIISAPLSTSTKVVKTCKLRKTTTVTVTATVTETSVSATATTTSGAQLRNVKRAIAHAPRFVRFLRG